MTDERTDQTDRQRFFFVNPDTKSPGLPLTAEAAVEAYADWSGYLVFPADHRQDREDYPKAGDHKLIMIADDADYLTSANSYHELAAELVADGYLVASPPLQVQQTPPAEIDEEEARKRRASQSIEAGNPPNLELAANIRPDIGSAPGGLVTFTTQKSSTYEANPDAEAKAVQQGDGLTPPEIAEATPVDAKEARRQRRNEALREDYEARRAETKESGEQITAEEGETITRDLGGGISI